MNASYTAFAAATLLAAASFTQAAVPPVDAIGKGAVIKCGTNPNGVSVRASHADKIIFVITGQLIAAQPDDQPVLDKVPRNTELDIKVLDDPRTVADLRGKVLTFLGALDIPPNRESLRILEVKYAMVCPTTTAP